ncbi:MAG: hypothetical protein O7F13_01820 [Gammaproteobacteria bacterium]|nr:hypothetical protein [Gammaproteobacteria bacterium]
MNHKKYIELIQAELDDELSDDQRAELDTLLHESTEARDTRKDFCDLAGLLRQVPSRQPPESLRQNILAQIELAGRQRPAPSAWAIPAAARMAMAFAAGIVITIGLFRLAPDEIGPTDTRTLVGSMVRNQALPDELLQDQLEVGLDTVQGSVELHRNNNLLMLEFEFDANEPVNLELDFAGQGLQFEGFAHQSVTPPGLRVSTDSIAIIASGEQSFVVFLAYTDEKDRGFAASITLEFQLAGGQTHQFALTDR